MTIPLQPTGQPTGPAAVRRPPAPRPFSGSVTRLGPGGTPETDVPVAAVQGTLALDLGPAVTAPALPALYAVDDEARCAAEVKAWAARFAQAVVEVTGGDRPLTQMLRWTNARVYAELGRRVRIMAQRRPAAQRVRSIRPQVRSVHVCQPTPATAEVSVHVRYGNRSRALAARLERRNGHWLCTALQVG